jgi:hypothetical protein
MPNDRPQADVYNKTLNDAIRSIYSVYGSNLAAFFRDVADPVTHADCKVEVYKAVSHPAERGRQRTHTNRVHTDR